MCAPADESVPRCPPGVQEAMRLQQLRHPHIVGFYGVMLAGSKGVVLMEYAEGTAAGSTAASNC